MDWKLSKRYPTSEDKEEATSRGRRGDYVIEATQYLPGKKPTDCKVTVSERLTYRSENSEPHVRSPCLRIWHWEKEPLEHLALKANGACAQELHGTGGNRDPILKRHTQTFTCTGSQGKARSP